MDCEKFDHHAMDALYNELDELTWAAMRRHMDSCARCASAFSGLRATRDVGVLPIEEPSEELEARILEAVAVAQKSTPFRRKALRALAWAGSHAMRPQLAMAALFVLVIGSSLLLLRAKPGTVGVAPVRVTERGVPAPDQVEAAPMIAPLPPPPVVGGMTADSRRTSVEGAAAEPDDRAAMGGDVGAATALKEALALQKKSGCATALGKLDEVGSHYPGTSAAHTAMWEAARCYKTAGNEDKAKELLLSLRSVSNYRDRAERGLAELEGSSSAQNTGSAGLGGKGGAAAPARGSSRSTADVDDLTVEGAPQSAGSRAAPSPPEATSHAKPSLHNAM